MNKHGTYANKSTDTSGLGEYSDAQLLKELLDRGIMQLIVGKYPSDKYWQEEVLASSAENKERFYQRRVGKDELLVSQHQRIKEIIGNNRRIV